MRVSVERQEQVHEVVGARAENIAPLRHAVAGFAALNGASDCELEDVALAVSEALTNAVLHAYRG
ncbi:MAG: Histidine kinaselike ATPase domain, partial [Solirubrobacteraceae bacterium]|nr:Histidine kinaselike ATPase domain [Solirubrobacteraceae bacterium]